MQVYKAILHHQDKIQFHPITGMSSTLEWGFYLKRLHAKCKHGHEISQTLWMQMTIQSFRQDAEITSMTYWKGSFSGYSMTYKYKTRGVLKADIGSRRLNDGIIFSAQSVQPEQAEFLGMTWLLRKAMSNVHIYHFEGIHDHPWLNSWHGQPGWAWVVLPGIKAYSVDDYICEYSTNKRIQEQHHR